MNQPQGGAGLRRRGDPAGPAREALPVPGL